MGDWRDTCFFWMGTLNDEPSEADDGAPEHKRICWRGRWVGVEHSVCPTEPSAGQFDASVNQFQMYSDPVAGGVALLRHGPAEVRWSKGWYLLDNGAGLEKFQDVEHVCHLVPFGRDAEATTEGPIATMCVAAKGSTEFGRFVSKGVVREVGGQLELVLARRYVKDSDWRWRTELSASLDHPLSEQPWLTLTAKAPRKPRKRKVAPSEAAAVAKVVALEREAPSKAAGLAIGVNFEGGKPVVAAVASPFCRGAFNCQIAMDAPFVEGEAAPDSVRSQGRTENTLGAQDEVIQAQLVPVFSAAAKLLAGPNAATVVFVQVARGRSAMPFWDAVVAPALLKADISAAQCRLQTGYRSSDYPDFSAATEPFVFINVGMFGRLSGGCSPGDVLAVGTTIAVSEASTPAAPASHQKLVHEGHDFALVHLPHCTLIALPDHFPFVTPDAGYTQKTLLGLATETQ